jgi:hypothetical protein
MRLNGWQLHSPRGEHHMAKNILKCLPRLTNKERNEIVGALNPLAPQSTGPTLSPITIPDCSVVAWRRRMSKMP